MRMARPFNSDARRPARDGGEPARRAGIGFKAFFRRFSAFGF
jgi:hypothetical protein